MTKDELITLQQLEIQNLKERLSDVLNDNNAIRGLIYCIGGPLNDNILNYTQEQKNIFLKIVNLTQTKGE